MARRMLALLVTFVTLFMLSTCGQAFATTGETITLQFWGGVPAEYGPQQVCDRFNELNKDRGVQMEYVRYVNDETGNLKLDTTLLAGGEVDLYISYAQDSTVKRSTGGMALPLKDRLNAIGFDPVEELGSSVGSYMIDGDYYSLPSRQQNFYLLANVDMFEEAGIPLPTRWTYEEFREAAQKLTHGEGLDKVYGVYWNTNTLIARPSHLAQQVLGSEFMYTDPTTTNLNHEAHVEIAQLVQDMMWVDKTAYTHTDSITQKLSVENTFLEGKVAMAVGVWAHRTVKDLENYPHDFVTAYIPAPVPTYDAPYMVSEDARYADFISINPKSKYVDEAFDAMMWYITEGIIDMTPYGRVPIYKGFEMDAVRTAFLSNAEDLFLQDEGLDGYLKRYDNAPVASETNRFPEVSAIFNEELEAIYTNRKDAQTALDDAKSRADAIFK